MATFAERVQAHRKLVVAPKPKAPEGKPSDIMFGPATAMIQEMLNRLCAEAAFAAVFGKPVLEVADFQGKDGPSRKASFRSGNADVLIGGERPSGGSEERTFVFSLTQCPAGLRIEFSEAGRGAGDSIGPVADDAVAELIHDAELAAAVFCAQVLDRSESMVQAAAA